MMLQVALRMQRGFLEGKQPHISFCCDIGGKINGLGLAIAPDLLACRNEDGGSCQINNSLITVACLFGAWQP
jgi:hypothetical protein